MKEDTTYDRIERSLFKDQEEAARTLSARELEIKRRMMLCVSKKMDEPLVEDAEIVNFLMAGCAGQAERVIVEGAKKAYDVAINNNDAKGAAACLDKIGKYTRCDKEDDAFDYSQMIPPSFEPSDDVTLVDGLEPVDNVEEKRRQLRAYFKGQAEDAKIMKNEE